MTSYTYDPLNKNNVTSITDPRLNVTHFYYDPAFTDLQSVQKPLGGITNYTYYSDGLVETVTDVTTNYKVTYTYDVYGNIAAISDNVLDTSIDFVNDQAGRMRVKSDQARPVPQVTSWEYDNNDNVVSMQVGSRPAAIYAYDRNDRLTGITDQRGKNTVYTFNAMNMLETQQSPDGKIWQYGYDEVGSISSVQLPDGNGVSYTYDANRRPQYVRLNGTEKLFYTYDNNGNMLSVRVDGDSGRTTGLTYDKANRVASVTDQFGNVVGYGYDAASNRNKITYPGNKVVTYTYDADNRLSTVKDWLGSAVTKYNYNNAGILQSVTNANGTSTEYGYDQANRLTALANKHNSSNIADYQLTLDNVGNPASVTRNDPLALPASAPSDTTYTHNNANQILTASSVSFTHDSLGNLSGASSGRAFSFDFANRLTNATVGGDTFTYLYDGFGNRVSRTKNGVQTKYLLDLNADMSNVLAETDTNGAVQNYYVHGLGLLSRIDSAGQRFTYHYDTPGNTVAVTDDNGTVVESYNYDEFGATLTSSPANSSNPFRYVGEYGVLDEGNGLLYMRARYYDTNTGRFLSRDPLGFKGGDLNLYAYVGGNPVDHVDPLGEKTLKDTLYKAFRKLTLKLGWEMLKGKDLFYNPATRLIYSVARNSKGQFVKGSIRTFSVTKELSKALSGWLVDKSVALVFGKGEDAPWMVDTATWICGPFAPACSGLLGNAKQAGGDLDPNDPDDAWQLAIQQGRR